MIITMKIGMRTQSRNAGSRNKDCVELDMAMLNDQGRPAMVQLND